MVYDLNLLMCTVIVAGEFHKAIVMCVHIATMYNASCLCQ